MFKFKAYLNSFHALETLPPLDGYISSTLLVEYVSLSEYLYAYPDSPFGADVPSRPLRGSVGHCCCFASDGVLNI